MDDTPSIKSLFKNVVRCVRICFNLFPRDFDNYGVY